MRTVLSNFKVGIIGLGVVGGALNQLCSIKSIPTWVYDKKFTSDPPQELYHCDLIFLCLPTPTRDDGTQDIGALWEVCEHLEKNQVKCPVVIRSTVLPITCAKLAGTFKTLDIVHNPEFVREKYALEDLLTQKSVLIGGGTLMANNTVKDFWKRITPGALINGDIGGGRYLSATATEMAKYIHNCLLAIKVSACNDIYALCHVAGVPYAEAMAAAASVGVIGENHTQVPGPDGKFGYGGMCFPKDMNALSKKAEHAGIQIPTIDGAIKTNTIRRT